MMAVCTCLISARSLAAAAAAAAPSLGTACAPGVPGAWLCLFNALQDDPSRYCCLQHQLIAPTE
jgi:hypothetical protein